VNAAHHTGQPPNGQEAPPAPAPSVFRRLIYDPRISHGAFHLWHYLRDRKNKNGQTWPTVRDIAADLHCKTSSLTGWTKELVSAGYLSVEKVGQKHNHRYTILPGDGNQGALPKWATRKDSRVSHPGDTKQSACIPNGQVVSPKEATPRVSHMGDISNRQEVKTSKGEMSPGFEKFSDWQLRKDYRESDNPAERRAIKAEQDRRKARQCPPAVPKPKPPQTANPADVLKPFEASPELGRKWREGVKAVINGNPPPDKP